MYYWFVICYFVTETMNLWISEFGMLIMDGLIVMMLIIMKEMMCWQSLIWYEVENIMN